MKSTANKKIQLTLSPQAARYAHPDAPLERRRMAAHGTLPLEAADLVHGLFVLAHDTDADVCITARKTLEGLPQAILESLLDGPVHPALLARLTRIHQDDDTLCQALALHPDIEDRALAFLAGLPHRHVVDIISQNQERLIRSEAIVEALGGNPLTGRAVVERILALYGDEDEEEAWQDPDWSEDQLTQAVLAVVGCDEADLARVMASEEEVEEESVKQNLFASIQGMSVMQKIKLARIGGKEARSLLIKDRNKVVATAVLASPKITESEVATIAQSRVVAEEILRIIATQRDWTRSYGIKLALCTNPKTPRPQAVKFLNYLREKDLRALMKSRDVPSVISTHARRILSKKGKI
ncbi:MAG: hypothetical protein ACJZ7Z_11335 [Myxococcota bacterium]|nr:MAG: hypothetical protein CBC32_007625 [Proteobacteria bacterium TMED72]